jgi:hypothetical protein
VIQPHSLANYIGEGTRPGAGNGWRRHPVSLARSSTARHPRLTWQYLSKPAGDAHIRLQPSGQGPREPRVSDPEFLGGVRGLYAFDYGPVVVVEELDGAGGVPLGNGVHDLCAGLVQRSCDPAPVLNASSGEPR